jgi:hypothetical protein
MALKNSQRELQLWFKPRPDPNSGRGAMNVQSPGTTTRDSFGTPTWESWEKKPFDVASAVRHKEYYMREGGGFLRVRAVVSLVCQSARGLSQHPRVFSNAN